MGSRVDLTQLSVNRDGPPTPRRGAFLTRLLLPGLLLGGFAALALYAARDSFIEPRAVTVIPVAFGQAGSGPADAPLFRAAGWVEPRPTPTVVTALAEGVVERVLVVEGQAVKAGEVVARLITADARLALEAADAEVELRGGEVDAARAQLAAAQVRLEHPVHLRADLAEAESALARLESDQAVLPAAQDAATARLRFTESSLAILKESGGAVSRSNLEKARSDRDAAAGAVQELLVRRKRLPVEAAALRARRDAQQAKLERKVDEVRHVAEAKAAVKTAGARRRIALAARDAARLRLDRLEVKAPTAGRVLSLVARPGTRLNGLATNSLQDSSTVLTMYDPASLQARVDVRLDDVARVRPGQKVRLESAAAPGGAIEGEVLLATSQADIQKNTLSVKVAILAPPPSLRPDMLCQVTFLAPPRPAGKPEAGPQRLLVPRQLLDGNTLWVVDQAGGLARRRTVEVGPPLGDLVEVVAGLAASDKLIVGGREGLRDGERVRVSGEDGTLGVRGSGKSPKR